MIPVRRLLSNGMRVILVPKPSSPLSSLHVATLSGAFYEPVHLGGISHLLEHVAYTGTKRRPHVQRLLRELDRKSKEPNAETSYGTTSFSLLTLPEDILWAIAIAADIYVNQKFPEKDLRIERGNVVEEINDMLDTPSNLAPTVMRRVMFGNQSAGRDILGTRTNVRRISRDDILMWRDQNYVAEAAFAVLAGDIGGREEEIIDAFEQSDFSNMPHNPHREVPGRPMRNHTSAKVRFVRRKTEQTHVSIGFEARPSALEDHAAMRVASVLLSNAMSMRLFHTLRTEWGGAYTIESEHELYAQFGIYTGYAGIDRSRAREGIARFANEFLRLGRELVGLEDLLAAQDIACLELTHETANDLAGFYLTQEALGLPLSTPEEAKVGIRSVTPERVLHCCESIFRPEKIDMAIVGPKPKGDIEAMLAGL